MFLYEAALIVILNGNCRSLQDTHEQFRILCGFLYFSAFGCNTVLINLDFRVNA